MRNGIIFAMPFLTDPITNSKKSPAAVFPSIRLAVATAQ
jgi:hypothetical protein